MPPYFHWNAFLDWFVPQWKVGEHIAGVGETGSGKTTFFRNILMYRKFAVVMGTKKKDPDLYPALESMGFVKREEWTPYEWEQTKERYVIFAPPLEFTDDATEREIAEAEEVQAAEFRRAMVQCNRAGGWCIDFDEVATIAIDMGLKRTLNLLYREGRSETITIVAATQRPREVPLNIFQQAKWIVLWNISDYDDRQRAAQYTGPLKPIVDYTVARLPRHEFLIIHKPTQQMVRSRVGG